MKLLDKIKQFISNYKLTSSEENLQNIEGNVPILKSIPIGIQHVLAMFVSNLTPLLIVFSSVNSIDLSIKQQIIQNGIFIAAIASLIQLLPIWKIGTKLPLLCGIGFSFIGVSIMIITKYSYESLLGAIIVGGIFTFLMAFTTKYWMKFFPPIVSGCFILGLGLSLIQSGVISFAGGENLMNNSTARYAFGSWQILLISSSCFISMILFNRYLKGFWKNLSILFSLLIGYIMCLFFDGMIDFSGLNNLTVFSFPNLINFSKIRPRFEISTIIPVIIIYLVVITECIGTLTIITEDAFNRKANYQEATGAISGVGLSSVISGFFGCLPTVTFTSSAAIVTQTKMYNRIPLIIGMLLMLLISFFPPVAAFIQTIPTHVIGSCTLMIFISIAVSGFNLIKKQGFNKRNVIILSVSLILGYGLTFFPELLTKIFHSNSNIGYLLFSNNVSAMFIFAFILNLILPKKLEQ